MARKVGKATVRSGVPLAKLTRPRLPAVFERHELLSRLDSAAGESSGIWIDGPPGAGKTTLVLSWLATRGDCRSLWYQVDDGDRDPASFFHYLGLAVGAAAPRYQTPMPRLTSEFLRGLPTFGRNFFRELSRRVKAPFALVLDNAHEAGSGGPFFEILRLGLEELPTDAHLIVVSRAAPPDTFARLRLNRQLALIDWPALRFNEQESLGLAEFLAARAEHGVSRERTLALHRQCDGWLAGLLLSLEAAAPPTAPDSATDVVAWQRLFDYFAGEVFDRRAPDVQEFLIATAHLPPSFDERMARELTGHERAGVLLGELVRERHFTQQSGATPATYHYHPLFREFLVGRGRQRLDAAALQALKHRVAEVAERAGARDEALHAFADCEDWRAVTRLVNELAPRYAAEGRFAAIAAALAKVPRPLLDAEPWLGYWGGISQQLVDPRGAAASFHAVYDQFRARGDGVGAYLTWTAAVHATIYMLGDLRTLDVWFERFVNLRTEHPLFPSPEIEQRITTAWFVGLVLRAPDHPDFPDALARAERLFAKPDAPPNIRASLAFYLLIYYLWLGKFAPARAIVDWLAATGDSAQAPPIVRTFGKTAETWFAALVGDSEAALAHMQSGLALARSTGVHIWEHLTISHGVSACLNRGDVAMAAQLLDIIERDLPRARDLDRVYYHHERAWIALLRSDVMEAQAHQQQALAAAARAGVRFGEMQAHYGMALVMHESGARESAAEHLAAARGLAAAFENRVFEVLCDLAEAEFALGASDEPRAAAALRRGFGVARQHGYTMFTCWRPRVMSRLCALALDQRIETEYVHSLIRAHGLESPGDAVAHDAWPFPVKVFALGQFTVWVDGRRLEFATKAQKKPLELLKAVIALGGTQVREERVVDLLWPDAEGAEQALKSAVHRLRKLIGEASIERGEGRLTLRRSHCWIDAFVLEQALTVLADASQRHDAEGAAAASARVLALYHGDLLATEAESAWALAARERLRMRTLRHIEGAARLLEQAGLHEQAIDSYTRGLEIDPLAEPFYGGLIRVYAATGRRADALRAYERCREVLAAELRAAPSAYTEALAQSVRPASESDR